MNEQELIEGLRAKDPAAIEHLYGEYKGRVRSVVKRFIRDEGDAEEVVQDTFWTVYRKIELFREDSALWSWMYRIAVNASKMRLRKYKRKPIPVDEEVMNVIRAKESMGFLDTRPDQQLAIKNMVAELHDFLQECDEVNRQLYIEMEMEGVSKEEIALKLDLTIPAVKTRLHRMRVGLRERLAPHHMAG